LLLTCGLAACATTAMDAERGLGSKNRKADDAQAGAARRVGAKVVGIAARMKGVPYVFGGSTPAGFDCSGLVHYSYARAGVPVPRTVQAQFAAATRISHEVAEPGDLLFFLHADKRHVAISMGGDDFIHAPWPGSTVSVATVRDNFYRSKLVGVGRLMPQ
jgi:murein DD-endopeptidase